MRFLAALFVDHLADGVDSYAAKDEDDAWDYAGEIPGFHEEYIRQAKELLALARRAVTE